MSTHFIVPDRGSVNPSSLDDGCIRMQMLLGKILLRQLKKLSFSLEVAFPLRFEPIPMDTANVSMFNAIARRNTSIMSVAGPGIWTSHKSLIRYRLPAPAGDSVKGCIGVENYFRVTGTKIPSRQSHSQARTFVAAYCGSCRHTRRDPWVPFLSALNAGAVAVVSGRFHTSIPLRDKSPTIQDGNSGIPMLRRKDCRNVIVIGKVALLPGRRVL